jgi:endonuclease/exonuclease/phosphatase family metal-dependent hydrolase
LTSPSTLGQQEPSCRLRLASWNLQSCRRGLPGIVAHLKAVAADLIALQEVDRCTCRSSGIDQAALLAREAGFAHHQFFPALERDGGKYGIALLSRFPLADPRRDRLPVPEGVEPRVLGRARLEHPGCELTVAVTHLSHRIGRSGLRLEQARRILELLAEESPCVLLGDFNDVSLSAMYRELTSKLVDVFDAAGKGRGGTHPLGWLLPTVRIDYLFASPEIVPAAARVERTNASDHHLLVAEVDVPAVASRKTALRAGGA